MIENNIEEKATDHYLSYHNSNMPKEIAFLVEDCLHPNSKSDYSELYRVSITLGEYASMHPDLCKSLSKNELVPKKQYKQNTLKGVEKDLKRLKGIKIIDVEHSLEKTKLIANILEADLKEDRRRVSTTQILDDPFDELVEMMQEKGYERRAQIIFLVNLFVKVGHKSKDMFEKKYHTWDYSKDGHFTKGELRNMMEDMYTKSRKRIKNKTL